MVSQIAVLRNQCWHWRIRVPICQAEECPALRAENRRHVMNSFFKTVFLTLPLVALGGAFLAYTVANKPPPERREIGERVTVVRGVTARVLGFTPGVTGYGVVRPARTWDAIAQVGGTADFVNPDLHKGAILPAGAVLLRLSPADFNLAIAQARANIGAARAKLDEIAVSEANVKSALAIEKEALGLKEAEMARIDKLFASGTASQTVRDNTRAAYLGQRQKVQSLESSLALFPTQRTVQTRQIELYRANLETAELNLGRTELVLPFAARVAAVSVETGQFVRVGQTTASMDGVGAAEVEAKISLADLRALLGSVRPGGAIPAFAPTEISRVLRGIGLKVVVKLQVGPEVIEWPAVVDRLSDAIDQNTGTVGVIVRVEDAYSAVDAGRRPPLTKGMFVEVGLTAPAVDGIVLPRTALRDGVVMIADAESRLKAVPVAAALVQGGRVLLRAGLEEGARVVVSRPNPLVEGMLLDWVADSDLEAEMTDGGVKP
jgi:multidrug efflux pump subunit AcrA (membrane-fusion protein)